MNCPLFAGPRSPDANLVTRRGAAALWVLLALCAAGVLAAAIAFGLRWPQSLPAVNASLNATATVLLLTGYLQIKWRRERTHKALMLCAFGISVLFLTCYVVHKAQAGSKEFPHSGMLAGVYYGILISHIILAAAVPFLAIFTIYLGLKDRRAAHRRLARWTFPIWLYVSVTGVVIYMMLYHL